MKKRTVKISNGQSYNFNYLIMVSVSKLKLYIEKYYGPTIDNFDKNSSSCVEVLHDNVIGRIYKIDYSEQGDLDYISQVKSVYVGQFGHLYKIENGFEYLPITNIENLNWYKFMHSQLEKTNLHELYPADFKEAHKVALIINKDKEIKDEYERHKDNIVNIEESFNNTYDLLDEYGVDYFIKEVEKEN